LKVYFWFVEFETAVKMNLITDPPLGLIANVVRLPTVDPAVMVGIRGGREIEAVVAGLDRPSA
jgi:hypothetical protein